MRLKDVKSNLRNKLASVKALQKIYSAVKVRFYAYRKVSKFLQRNNTEIKALISKGKTGQNILPTSYLIR